MHLIYVVIGVTCLVLRFKEYDQFRADGHDGHGFAFAGALFQLAECVVMVSTPLWYMVEPPTVPGLKDLLEEGKRPKARGGDPNYVLNKTHWFLNGYNRMQLLLDVLVVALCFSL